LYGLEKHKAFLGRYSERIGTFCYPFRTINLRLHWRVAVLIWSVTRLMAQTHYL